MSRVLFPEQFRRARFLLRKGLCPGEDDLRFLFLLEPVWLDHLGYSEKEKAQECWGEYE
jgi:hypothetical protein